MMVTGHLVLPSHAGGDLDALLRREGGVRAGQVQGIARQLPQGVAAVHEEGIVHGDIKPSNVLLRDEECRSAVLADFDVSHDSASRTTTSVQMGTRDWTSPELHVRGARATTASDMYACGLVLRALRKAVMQDDDDDDEDDGAHLSAALVASLTQ